MSRNGRYLGGSTFTEWARVAWTMGKQNPSLFEVMKADALRRDVVVPDDIAHHEPLRHPRLKIADRREP